MQLNLTGDNVANMLVRRGSRVTATLRGILTLETGSVSVALPSLSCLLTNPTPSEDRFQKGIS